MKRLWILACAGAFAFSAAGCGTIYTTREFGPQEYRIVLTKGLTFEEAVMRLGQPDSVQDLGNGVTIVAYRSVTYKNVLGVYAETRKSDYVLTFVNGRLTSDSWAPTGEDTAILAPQVHTLGVGVRD